MVNVLLLLAILPLAFCVDETLPTPAELLAEIKNVTCAEFIHGKPNTWCRPDPSVPGNFF